MAEQVASTVTLGASRESDSSNAGTRSCTRSSQPTKPSSTSSAVSVDANAFDSDASRNTVSVVTGALVAVSARRARAATGPAVLARRPSRARRPGPVRITSSARRSKSATMRASSRRRRPARARAAPADDRGRTRGGARGGERRARVRERARRDHARSACEAAQRTGAGKTSCYARSAQRMLALWRAFSGARGER